MSWPVLWDLFGGRVVTALFIALVVWGPVTLVVARCIRNSCFDVERGND